MARQPFELRAGGYKGIAQRNHFFPRHREYGGDRMERGDGEPGNV
jgi:hypothetical protein